MRPIWPCAMICQNAQEHMNTQVGTPALARTNTEDKTIMGSPQTAAQQIHRSRGTHAQHACWTSWMLQDCHEKPQELCTVPRRAQCEVGCSTPGLPKGSCTGVTVMGRADSWPATVATMVLISSSLRISSGSAPDLAGLPNLQQTQRAVRLPQAQPK